MTHLLTFAFVIVLAEPATASCLTSLQPHSCVGTLDAESTDETIEATDALELIDADCEIWTGDADEGQAVEFSQALAPNPDRSCWFSGQTVGPFPALGGQANPVYECVNGSEHCNGSDCCLLDPFCPGCSAEIPGYNGYHTKQAMEFHSSATGTAAGTSNLLWQTTFSSSGDGLSVADDGNVPAGASPLIDVRTSCFAYLRDDAIEDDFRKHSIRAQGNIMNRVNFAFAYDDRDGLGSPPASWTFHIRANTIWLYKFSRTYKMRPKFGGLFKEDGAGYFPAIKFLSNHIFLKKGPPSNPQYNLSDPNGIPSIYPDPAAVTACASNLYHFGGTQAEWDALDAAGVNAGRRAALNAAFPGCISVSIESAQGFEDYFDTLVANYEVLSGVDCSL